MERTAPAGAGLGPLQHEVLNLIIAHPGATVRELRERINAGEGAAAHAGAYAYTTIQAVCDALHRKQLVSRRRDKLAFEYRARTSNAGLFAAGLRSLLERFAASPEPIASGLVDSLEAQSPEQLEALIAELRQRGKI
jgi:predicted transcriptional regulator